MYLSTFTEKSTGRTYLVIKESFRKDGKAATRTVKSLGYLDELEKEYEDPIAYFKAEAKRLTEEKKEAGQKICVTFEGDALLPFDRNGEFDRIRNLGSVFIMKMLHEMGLEQVFRRIQKRTKAEFSLFEVMKLLVYQRMLDPDSKKSDWESKGRYFEKMDFTIDSVYRGLTYMNEARQEIIEQTDIYARENLGRKTGLMFYDVTNYFFEIEDEDGFRMDGFSKENRRLPIVQMGLFMDRDGFPVSYKLFSGNTNDCLTLLPSMEELGKEFGLEHMIVVADKGMYSGDNISRLMMEHNGYVISSKVRGAAKDVLKKVYDQSGYQKYDGKGNRLPDETDDSLVSYKYKTWDYVDDMYVTDESGKRKRISMNKKRIIYWSRKYSERAKMDRMKALEKAMLKVGSGSKSKIDNRYGANRYLKTEVSDSEGNDVLDYVANITFDNEKLAEDEKADGYYIIETNVKGLADGEPEFEGESRWIREEGMLQLNQEIDEHSIIDMYKGLWQIEQNFRITKTGLSARPVYLSRKDRIDAHFLICFLSLFVVRLIQWKMDRGKDKDDELTSCFRIIEELRKLTCADMDGTNFLLLYYSELIRDMKDALSIKGIKNVMTRGELRKICGDAKKVQ